MQIHDEIELIDSREKLVEFINKLKVDYSTNTKSWENTHLDSYLDAMGAWVNAQENLYRNTGREPLSRPTWRMIAEMLYAAKLYE